MSGGRLEVKVDGNSSGFKRAIDDVRTQAKAVTSEITHSWSGGLMKSLGTGIAGFLGFEGVKSMFESFISNAKQIKDISDQLDMSTDATQKWAKAAQDVGQSLEGVYSVLSAIQSKRQEALRDPHSADLFGALGISRNDVLNQNNSDFAMQVLMAGGASDENRKVLEEIVGRRGLKLIPAASRYGAEKPDYDSAAIKSAEEAEAAERNAWSALQRNFVGPAAELLTDKTQRKGFWAMLRALATPKGSMGFFDTLLGRQTDEREFLHNAVLGAMGKTAGVAQVAVNGAGVAQGDPVASLVKLIGTQLKSEADIKSYVSKNGITLTDEQKKQFFNSTGMQFPDGSANDPLIGIKSEMEAGYKLQREEAQLGLHEAERRNMTIAARKQSIQADIATLDKEIAERKKAQDEGRIYGMTLEQQKQLLPTDIDKQKQADFVTLLGLQARAAGLTTELHESKGFSFSADSMARVGLYSGSTLNLNPMLQIGQQQLRVLNSIERNTSSQNRDPYQP